jgi:hypothetical protein
VEEGVREMEGEGYREEEIGKSEEEESVGGRQGGRKR